MIVYIIIYIYIILWLNQEYTRWRNVCSMQYNKDPLLIYCLFGKTHGQPHRAIGTSLDSPFCDSLTPKLLPNHHPKQTSALPKKLDSFDANPFLQMLFTRPRKLKSVSLVMPIAGWTRGMGNTSRINPIQTQMSPSIGFIPLLTGLELL